MFCNACGCKLEDNDKFCPLCGAKVTPEETEDYPDISKPTQEYVPHSEKEYAPVDSGCGANGPLYQDDGRTVVLDGYDSPSYFQENFAESINENQPYPQEYPQSRPPRDYLDSFENGREPGYYGEQERYPEDEHKYQKTTAGRRAVSILMCLLMLLFSFFSLIIGSARIALTENNVRSAYRKGTLADLKFDTANGEKTLAQIIVDGAVNADTGVPIRLDEGSVTEVLRSQNINNFAENLAVDFTQFFIFGRAPSLLNSTEITGFLTSVSENIKAQTGYAMSDEDIAAIGKRINGGDLSFLSVDSNGGYFKQKYNFNPMVLSSAFSVWALAVCAGIVLLCLIMIFVINSRNLPAGLSFNGTTMMIFGVLNTVIAVGMLVFSYVKPIFLLSDLLRGLAFAMGAISLSVLVIGIIFVVIKTVLKNKAS